MLNMQNVKDIEITEGNVRTIHDKDSRLIWGRLAYDTKYAGDTFQQTYSGKNLFHIQNNTRTETNITWTITENYHAVGYGTADSGAGSYLYESYTQIDYPTDGNFTFSISSVVNAPIYYRFYNDDNTNLGQLAIAAGTTSITGTIPSGATKYRVLLAPTTGVNYDIDIYLQLERGSTSTSIEPYVGGIPAPNPDYPQDVNVVTGEQTVTLTDGVNSEDYTVDLGSTELSKIGSYQDYIYKSGDDWYVHKETNKHTFTGSENWYLQTSGTPSILYCGKSILSDAIDSAVQTRIYSDYFHYAATYEVGRCYLYNRSVFVFYGDTSTTVSTLKTWLSTHNTTVYYPIATPTDTQITDATLIGQLDAIHQFLTRYGYNATVSGNLPMIINQTALS